MALPLRENEVLELSVMRPFDSLERYGSQIPCVFHGRVAWARPVDGTTEYGIEFVDLSTQDEKDIAACYTFFRTSPTFDTA